MIRQCGTLLIELTSRGDGDPPTQSGRHMGENTPRHYLEDLRVPRSRFETVSRFLTGVRNRCRAPTWNRVTVQHSRQPLHTDSFIRLTMLNLQVKVK